VKLLVESLKFESKITKFETLNPLFSKVKIKIAYAGLNRNNSYISKEAFEKAIPSIFHCPIIGEYNESIEDFKGHGGKLEITDSGINWVNTTIPYGVIDSDSEITWEDTEEDDGTIKSYLCATGYLWTGRYPELNDLIENSKSQSMEIEIESGNYTKIDDKKVYEITDFIFSGFCILGDEVEPCFESSEVVTYSLNKDKFKKQFNQMVAELKFSLQSPPTINEADEGGQKMEELQLLLDKYSLTIEDLSAKEINHEEFSLEELESKIQEVFKQEEPKDEFTLTSEQLEDELKRELGEIETVQDAYWEDYSYPRFSFVDYMPEQNVVVAYDCQEGILIGFNYSLTNENVEVDATSAVRYKVDFVPMNLAGDPDNDEFSMNLTHSSQVDHKVALKEKELTKQFEAEKATAQDTLDKAYAEFAKLQEDYSKLEESAKELEQFKLTHLQQEREDAENELFAKFSDTLTEDEMASIKEKKSEFSIEVLEEKLFAIAGRKKLSFSKAPEQKPIRYSLPIDNKPSNDKEWADLIEKHKNK
jgi:hypothetical protein